MIVYAYLGVGAVVFMLGLVFLIWREKGMTRSDYITFAIVVAIVVMAIVTVWVLGATHNWRLKPG